VLSPEHIGVIAKAGWSKSQVKAYLFSQACRSVDGLKSVGKYRERDGDRQHKDASSHPLVQADKIHRGLMPEDIPVVMGGGDAGGHSCFIPSWSRGRRSLIQSNLIGVCIDCGTCQ
jgi:hypothetical protein